MLFALLDCIEKSCAWDSLPMSCLWFQPQDWVYIWWHAVHLARVSPWNPWPQLQRHAHFSYKNRTQYVSLSFCKKVKTYIVVMCLRHMDNTNACRWASSHSQTESNYQFDKLCHQPVGPSARWNICFYLCCFVISQRFCLNYEANMSFLCVDGGANAMKKTVLLNRTIWKTNH